MKKQKQYSLWLMPSGKVYSDLFKIISSLSQKYSAPSFLPHITLLGRITGFETEVLFKCSRLAKNISSYKVEFDKVNYLDQYYRCLFIRIKETKEVMNANANAKEIFNHRKDPKYMPHLSLLYGDFPESLKKLMIKDIGSKFNVSFKVNHIHLFLTEDIKNWHKVKEFSLNNY